MFYQLFLLLRPWQWVKNLAVYAPIFFAGALFHPVEFLQTSFAFLALCLLSSSHYIINDIVDAPQDKLDPNRKHRPVASSRISLSVAWVLWGICAVFGMLLAFMLGPAFFVVALIYSVIHYLLLFLFRHMPILDILALATGYGLRLYAGEVASDTHISIWLALSAFSLALLFAVGKRRHEWNMKYASVIRERYSERLLDSYIAVFSTASFLSYTYFTFLTTFALEGIGLSSDGLDPARKWLMLTIPFVLYGILRFLQQLYIGKPGSFQKLLISDIPLLVASAGWGMSAFVIIYWLR